MATYEEKLALREKGFTYREIGEKLGISHQAVAQSLGKRRPEYFRHVKESVCIYAGIREWMNENRVSVRELNRRLGYIGSPNAHSNLRKRLSGATEIKKGFIDKMLAVTGLTYEQAFRTEGEREQ